MKNKSRKYNIRQELRKIVYMLCMVVTIFLTDFVVVNATTEDDGATAEQILDNRQEDEERTNIREPGSAQTGEELQKLNIANSLTIEYDRRGGIWNKSYQ